MADIVIYLKIKETEAQIRKLIMDGVKDVFNNVLRTSAYPIQRRIREYFKERLMNSDAFKSLDGGKLHAEFGIPKESVSGRLNNIADEWLRQIIVDYTPIHGLGQQWTGGIKINMLETDWQKVISMSDAYVETRGGWGMWWLEWLLTYGDRFIVKEYRVKMINSSRSRSGLALMVKDTTSRWRVPPEFSGTTNNNFITKLLDTMPDDIDNIIEEELTKRLI